MELITEIRPKPCLVNYTREKRSEKSTNVNYLTSLGLGK